MFSCFFLHENSFLTVRGNQRKFFEITVLGTGELIIYSLIMMYHLHLRKWPHLVNWEVLGRKCNGLFQSKQTSERMKPQSLYSLSWLRFKLATLKIQVTSITVWANLLIVRGEEYMQSIKKPNIWNSQTASARSTLTMVALYSGDFKLYSDTSSITPPQLVIEWRALDCVCV